MQVQPFLLAFRRYFSGFNLPCPKDSSTIFNSAKQVVRVLGRIVIRDEFANQLTAILDNKVLECFLDRKWHGAHR
jgi:hypothetical protein